MSQLLAPTLKEEPVEAEIASHKLMLRAGLMRMVARGTYTYLPLGLRAVHKVMAIVREELAAIGAQELLF
ncbi:MAG TPA: proline--tRNA ligase, partial [Limnochordia bacterium]|nr:proline--tRNA ligase [Limnochordia bacterium]